MSQRHPIDVFFRRRLAKYDAGAPMHVWDKIQAYQQRRRQLRRLYWLGGSASALALLIFFAFPVSTKLVQPEDTGVQATAPAERMQNRSLVASVGAPAQSVAQSPAVPTSSPASQPAFSQSPATIIATTVSQPAVTLPDMHLADISMTENAPVPDITDAGGSVAVDEPISVLLHQPTTSQTLTAVSQDVPVAPVHTTSDEDPGYRMTGPHVRAQSQWVAPLPPARQGQSHLSATPDWHHLKPSTGCAGLQIRNRHWGLEILGGPLTSFHGLSARSQEQQEYLSVRRNTERNRLSLGSQLRLVYHTPAGLRLRLGVQYLQVNQHFTYENPDIMEIRIVPQLGNNGEIIGSDTIYTPLQHHTKNRYQWINIPLLAGYEFKSHKLRLGFLAGPVFNVRFDASGEIIAPDSRQPAVLGNENEQVAVPAYRSNAGIGWYGGISASVNLYGKYSLFTEASVQHFQRSLTIADYPLKHQPWIGNLLLGVRTRL